MHDQMRQQEAAGRDEGGQASEAAGKRSLVQRRYAGGERRAAASGTDTDARGAIDSAGDVDGREDDKDGGKEGGKEGGKDETPTVTGVALGTGYAEKTDTKYGLVTPIIIRGTQLDKVMDSELVGASIDHTGSFASRPSAKSNNSGFMKADKIPDDHHSSGIADHLKYFDNHGGDGSYSRLQMDLYKIPSVSGETIKAIPSSGYRIKRSVKKVGEKVVGTVTKTPEACTIDSYTTTEGLGPSATADVTIRG